MLAENSVPQSLTLPKLTTAIDGISTEIEHSIEKLTADSVVGRLFYEIDRIAEPVDADKDWLNQILEVIRFSQDIEIGFGHAKAYALAIIKKHWEELPLDVRKGYDYQFMTFARQVTGKEQSTIANYISTAELWFIDKKAPEGTVQVKVRDLSGKPLYNPATGEVRTRTADFSPYQVDLSKLLQVNAVARRNAMTPQLWEMLVDDYYTCDDIRAVLGTGGSAGKDEFYYFIEGPGLFVMVDGFAVCLTEELNWMECESDERVAASMQKFLAMLGIDTDAEENKLYALNHAATDKGYIIG